MAKRERAIEATGSEAPKRRCVLVVEDDPETQTYMRLLLERSYEVLCAASAEEARSQLGARPGDVAMVLMDLSLKGDEDGLSLTRQLRQDPVTRLVPVIAVTAHALPEDERKALGAGCDDYVSKPFRHEELLARMARLMARRESPPAT